MAFAREVYEATEEQADFAINFPYLSITHVKLFLNGVELTQGEAPEGEWVIVSGTIAEIEDPTEISSGDSVVVLRNSSRSARLVDYQISTLTEDDLDTDSLQAFYLVQEAIDAAATALGLDASDLWDATSKRITEVAEPTAAADAATKAYVDEVLTTIGNLPASAETEDGDILVVTTEGAVAWNELAETYIPDGLIDAGMLATGAVTGVELADLAVNTEHLVNESVTGLKLEDTSINEEHFVSGSVDETALANAGVTLAKLDPTAGTEGQVPTNEEATSVVWATPSSGPEGPTLLSAATSVGTGATVDKQDVALNGLNAWLIELNGISVGTSPAQFLLQIYDNAVLVNGAGTYDATGVRNDGGIIESAAHNNLTAVVLHDAAAIADLFHALIYVRKRADNRIIFDWKIWSDGGADFTTGTAITAGAHTDPDGFRLAVSANAFDAGTWAIYDPGQWTHS